jgi:pimeloyl-ACP methyl ester carboxylesterase
MAPTEPAPAMTRWPSIGASLSRLLGWAARGLGVLLIVCLLMAVAGFTYQVIATEQEKAAYPPPGQLIDVGGHRLHIQCVGAGSPTVVTESGLGGTSLDWSLVQPSVAQTTRIRAGFGWSEVGPSPRSSGRIVEELRSLLAGAGIAGPYVLVGHSVGGLHTQLLASRYASAVAGLVLLDPTPAAYLASLEPSVQRDSAPPMEQLRMLQLMQPIGLTRLLGLKAPMPMDNLSPAQQRQVKAVSFTPAGGNALYEEAAAYAVDLAEALAAAPLRTDIPLVVLLRGLVEGPPDQDAAGKAANADLVRRSSRGQLVIAERSHHYIQLDRPDLVIDATNQVVESVRTEGVHQ